MAMNLIALGACSLGLLIPTVGVDCLMSGSRSPLSTPSQAHVSTPDWFVVRSSAGVVISEGPIVDHDGEGEDAAGCPKLIHSEYCAICESICVADTTCTVFLTGAAGTCKYNWRLNGLAKVYFCECQ